MDLKKTSSKTIVDDDIVSIGTLKREISNYMDRCDSATYHELYPGVEMINYDFTEERQHVYSTNLIESTAHLIKGCLGAGVFGIHEGFMYGGMWTSLISAVIIGILVSNSMMMLVKSAHKMYGKLRVTRLTYADLVEVVVATGPLKIIRRYSKIFRYVLELFLLIQFNGTCCIFEIMIAITWKKILVGVSPKYTMDFPIRIYILMVMPILVLLCLIRNLKYLAPFSLLADISAAICVLITMYISIEKSTHLSERAPWKSVQGWFRFCGVCLYSIDGVGVTLPIENHMRRPREFKTVLQIGMSFVMPFIMILGFFGYWAWGEQCQTPITIHLQESTAEILIQFLLAMALLVTFTIHFWVAFRIVWHYIGKRYKKKRGVWERLYRVIFFLFVSGLAAALPTMNIWMGLLGNFILAFIVFIYPAFIETLVTWNEHKKGQVRWIFMKNLCLIVIGMVLCGGSVYAYV